jgi:hypothetical protein
MSQRLSWGSYLVSYGPEQHFYGFPWSQKGGARTKQVLASPCAWLYREGRPGCHSQTAISPVRHRKLIEESIMKAMRFFCSTGSTLARTVSFPPPSVRAGLGTKVIPARESDGRPRISVGVSSLSGTKRRGRAVQGAW